MVSINAEKKRIQMNLEKHIRCKCGKYWGMKNHRRKCKRCKTEVIARGGLNDKK